MQHSPTDSAPRRMHRELLGAQKPAQRTWPLTRERFIQAMYAERRIGMVKGHKLLWLLAILEHNEMVARVRKRAGLPAVKPLTPGSTTHGG